MGLLAAGTVMIALLATTPAVAAPDAPVVVTAQGAVQGKNVDGVHEFLGIPYAAPPVGDLRWRAPQPPAAWPGVRDATRFAPFCLQPPSPLGGGTGAEDCLYLNVFGPTGPPTGRPRPVMVWIQGGGLVTGKADDYDPTPLVRDGVLVVTLNYRLGVLGFLAHPALTDRAGGPSGDYGLMDQQAALRWVRRNIARFGGDPRDVTLFGQSAGGLSVLAQLASPGARGLFDRAIVQSGAFQLTQASLGTAEAAGEAFATQVGCGDQSAACLRGLSDAQILAGTNPAGYRPDVDGRVLTESLGTAFATGRFNRMPVIDGTNHDEYRLYVGVDELLGTKVTAANYQSLIQSLLGKTTDEAASIAAHYPVDAYPSPAIALGAAGTDLTFACPALTADRDLARYVPLYAYEFNDEDAPQQQVPPVSFPYGAAHASELQYLFGLPNAPYPAALSPSQERLAAAMRRDWTGFAARGRPGWPRYDPATQRMASLVPPASQLETGFATAHQCAFWNHLDG